MGFYEYSNHSGLYSLSGPAHFRTLNEAASFKKEETMYVIPALGELRQVTYHQFKASLGYLVSFRPALATDSYPA